MYVKIFNEIVDIMHHDYAGCIDKRGWDNPKKYVDRLKTLAEKDKLDPKSFVAMITY